LQAGAPVAARLLVGADGNASAVWDHLFPEAPLRYTGVSVWRTVIPKPPDWFELGTAVTWEGARRPALVDLEKSVRLGQAWTGHCCRVCHAPLSCTTM